MNKLEKIHKILLNDVLVRNYDRISFDHQDNDYIIDNISSVVFYKKCKKECIHCGYGTQIYALFKISDIYYGYLNFWSGCLSYDPHGTFFMTKYYGNINKQIQEDGIDFGVEETEMQNIMDSIELLSKKQLKLISSKIEELLDE